MIKRSPGTFLSIGASIFAAMEEFKIIIPGSEKEKFSVLGWDMDGIGNTPAEEIETILCKAIDHAFWRSLR